MKTPKYILAMIAGCVALVMVFGLVMNTLPLPAQAATSSELKAQLNELEAEKQALLDKIKDLQSQMSDNLQEMEQMADQKSLMDQEIFLMHQQIGNINNQIATCNLLIADKQAELDKAEARLEELSRKNKERIRAMEEDGVISYWSVLFKANSFSDFLDRLNMIQEIAAADRRHLQEMSQAAQVVAQAKAEMEDQKLQLEATKVDLKTTAEELSQKQESVTQLLGQMASKGEEFDKLLEESEQKQDQLMQEIANKKDDYDEAKHKEWLATSVAPTTKPANTPGTSGSGVVDGITWLVPCKYVYFSSPFGPRWGRMHNGVDLAAYQGTPIVATRSGYVAVAAYEAGGAGYYVSLNHGDGYRSIYMHMTHYIVRAGQYVTAGQVIGYVGSTGRSEGPHLHFGISYNGTYVNPANYITIR